MQSESANVPIFDYYKQFDYGDDYNDYYNHCIKQIKTLTRRAPYLIGLTNNIYNIETRHYLNKAYVLCNMLNYSDAKLLSKDLISYFAYSIKNNPTKSEPIIYTQNISENYGIFIIVGVSF